MSGTTHLSGTVSNCELPSGWAETTLADVALAPRQKIKPDPHSSLPFIGMEHIEANSLTLSACGKFREMKSAAGHFYPGDVLYGRMRPYLNKVHCVSFEGACSAEFIVFPKSVWLNSDFLKYLLHDRQFVSFASHQTSGDRPRVDFEDIKGYRFWLPPLEDQDRIVAKLDELFSRIEKGEENLKRVQALVKRYRQAVLKAAVTGELTRDWRAKNAGSGESGAELLKRILAARRAAWEKAELRKIKAKGKPPKDDKWKQNYKEPVAPDTTDLPELPEGWVWTTLDQLSWASSYGISSKCSYGGHGEPVLRIPNVRSGQLTLDDLKFAKDRLSLVDPDYLLTGDLLVIRTNGSRSLIGAGTVVGATPPRRTYFASYLIRFRIVDVCSLHQWVNTFWQSEFIRALIYSNAATSAGQYNIAQTRLQRFPIAIPSAGEQEAIIESIESLVGAAEEVEKNADSYSTLPSALRNSILERAFVGRLVPQDPNDEPASTLLEHVAAERARPSRAQPKRTRSLSAADVSA